MGKFIRGDIVVVPFPFSDLSLSKRRPALVLVDSQGRDLILCQITSQNVADNMAVAISINDVSDNALKTASNARPNKLFTADESIVLYKIGALKSDKFDKIIFKIVDMFKPNHT